jgi:hypothetical protein
MFGAKVLAAAISSTADGAIGDGMNFLGAAVKSLREQIFVVFG